MRSIAICVLATLVFAGCNSASSECKFDGATLQPGDTVVSGCVFCGCGPAGSKSAGLTCTPISGCDGGADGR